MLKMVTHNKFKRDWKRAIKRGKDINVLYQIMIKLARQEKLEQKYKGHKLKGKYNNRRECHIEPDWLLIYRIEIENECIIFDRTGSHSDLFKN